jgi:DNA (cytosine-5)-methyltransferase 1
LTISHWWDGSDCAATLTKQNAAGNQHMPDKGNFGAVLQPIVGALTARGPTSMGVTQIDANQFVVENGNTVPQTASARYPEINECMSTILATDNEKWGCNQWVSEGKAIVEVCPVAFSSNMSEPDFQTDGSTPTLKVGSGVGIPSPPAVACINMQVSKSNACVSTDGTSFTLNAMHGHDVHSISQAMTVRRLTPRECERLQGFPDDWTLIPWRGKAADQCSDGPRYRALGNSMAVNCMEWIGERIQMVEDLLSARRDGLQSDADRG